MKFYLEEGTNNLVASKVPLKMCENFKELTADSTDAATEKHVPVVNINGDNVEVIVGSVEHPMTDKHWITTIVLETENGFYKRNLQADEEPKANFVTTDKPVAVYEYCNLHGLWVSRV